MRGLVEIRLLWLITVTLLAYSGSQLGVTLSGLEFLLLLFISWPPQKVTVFGFVALFIFGALLALLDIVFGGFNPSNWTTWVIVGASYLVLYEYVALYEISAFLADYHVPRVIISIINFGFRFIPVTFDATYETYLGLKAKNKLPKSGFAVATRIAPSVLVMILHKFEQMWISYNIRFINEEKFNVTPDKKDLLFGFFCILNIGMKIYLSY